MKTIIIATLLALASFTATAQVHGTASVSVGSYAGSSSASDTQEAESGLIEGWPADHSSSSNQGSRQESSGYTTGSFSRASSGNGSEWTLIIVTGVKGLKAGTMGFTVTNLTITKTPGYAFPETCNRAAKLAKLGKFTMDAYCINSP